MSNLVIRVGVPGPQGNPAYTTSTANYVQPAVLSTVSVPVVLSSWAAIGEMVYVAGGGYYLVSSIPDATHLVLTNTGAAGNASVGSTVVLGKVTPSGVPGNAFSKTVNDSTTNRVLSSSDAGAYIRMGSASANTVTVNAGVFSQDDEVSIFQAGVGATSLVAGVGVTINASVGLTIEAQFRAVTLKCVAPNVFDAIGALKA